MPSYPELPILPAAPNRRSNRERYGSLFYLGIGGLLILLGLILWFGWGVWELRDIWRDTFVLHDGGRSETERILAADRLAHDPRVATRQKLDILLDPKIPELARWRIGESLDSDAAETDPVAFVRMVLEVERGPAWLKLAFARVLADASDHGVQFPPALLDAVNSGDDPWLQAWLAYTRAFQRGVSPEHRERLEQLRRGTGPAAPLAELLARAAEAEEPRRSESLKEAFLSTRSTHPDILLFWRGWTERQGRLRRQAEP